MDKNELKKLKEDLIKEKETVETELERFTTKNPVVKDDYETVFPKSDSSDTLDEQAHSVTQYEEEKSLEYNLELRLKEINKTLEKIEAGKYGICASCQSSIEEKRLQAIPVAKLCVSCANKK